jgi:hypothetical protein
MHPLVLPSFVTMGPVHRGPCYKSSFSLIFLLFLDSFCNESASLLWRFLPGLCTQCLALHVKLRYMNFIWRSIRLFTDAFLWHNCIQLACSFSLIFLLFLDSFCNESASLICRFLQGQHSMPCLAYTTSSSNNTVTCVLFDVPFFCSLMHSNGMIVCTPSQNWLAFFTIQTQYLYAFSFQMTTAFMFFCKYSSCIF